MTEHIKTCNKLSRCSWVGRLQNGSYGLITYFVLLHPTFMMCYISDTVDAHPVCPQNQYLSVRFDVPQVYSAFAAALKLNEIRKEQIYRVEPLCNIKKTL